ncbi:unnamed protein product, partial [Didymodactylos carnosus]
MLELPNSGLKLASTFFFPQKFSFIRSISKMSSSETAVFGHSNPDTDAIASAIVYATFLNRMGVKAKPYRLADVNNETTFVLHEANVEQPDFVGDLPDGTEVALVDHNESQQSVQNIKKLKITRVVDHHKLGDLTTSSPIFIRMEPVGCTGTILAKLFRENDLDIDKSTARLLVSSILSDTLHFRSTTTSDDDRKLLDYLTPIAEIKDVKDYALKMFEAKSDISNMSPDKILKLDYKIFPFDNEKWAIGVIETTNPKHALDRKQELLDEI